MKTWKLLISGIAAAGIAAAVLLRKTDSVKKTDKESISRSISGDAGENKPLAEGLYSFISGFQDAATVEVTLNYDPERYRFCESEEGLVAETSDSHVAVLTGGQVELQVEYASYYEGETFEDLTGQMEHKFSGFSRVAYGASEGICYTEGDRIRMYFPAGRDTCSYLVITAKPGCENDEELGILPENPELKTILASLCVNVK